MLGFIKTVLPSFIKPRPPASSTAFATKIETLLSPPAIPITALFIADSLVVVAAASSSASSPLEVSDSICPAVLAAAALLKIFAGLILLKHAVRLASTKLAKAAKDKFKNTFLVIVLINFDLLP